MMENYYFLITLFPPLSLDQKLEMGFKELKDLLWMNLSQNDLQRIKVLLLPIDIYNIRAFWLGEPMDDRGLIRANEMEERILVQEDLPDFVIDYLQYYESIEERLKNFASIYASLYRDYASQFKGFLRKYFFFEREVRLVLTALRAKKAKKDLIRELQFEDPDDPFVAQILAQKDADDYFPPMEYEPLKTLFFENYSDPDKLNIAILKFRFERIEEMDRPQDFGIDRVLSYVARFLIQESLAKLSKEKGMEQLSQYE